MNSESEDDLPSYGFQWKPDNKTSDEDPMDTLNVDEILARRRKDEEMFAEVHKLDDILKSGLKLNGGNENSKIAKSSDEDVNFILESAKQMVVVESTVKTKPHCVIINPELCMDIFNFQTLKPEHFISLDMGKYTKLYSTKFEDLLTNESLRQIDCRKTFKESLFTYYLYLMSVHPFDGTAEMYFNLLCTETNFRPSLSDFINIFRNWGCELVTLYKTVPNTYTGLHEALKLESPKSRIEVKRHNLGFVLRYLIYLTKFNYCCSFCDLIEPLMRMFFDVRIYEFYLQNFVSEVLVTLIRSIGYPSTIPSSKNISLKDIHLKDLTLQQQMIICTKILRRTPFGIPLAYAALQQYLGRTDIIYCQHIEMRDVYNLLVTYTNIVEESSYLDIYCFLQIIETFLCQKEKVGGEICEPEINHENWHDLFHDWSLRVCNSDNCADPVYVKEKIAQVQYLLRMRRAMAARSYNIRN